MAQALLSPLLLALPAAAASSQPPSTILPHLAPILRQRVSYLSASSDEPWIRLLSYDSTQATKLAAAARSERFEPHPVSGEIELDWDYDIQVRYRRLDTETLQALVSMGDLEIVFKLVHTVNDPSGDKDGWRVGEVGTPDAPSAFSSFGGFATIAEAERAFTQHQTAAAAPAPSAVEEEDEDDDYWDRYDATPARTPAAKRSPAPQSVQNARQSAEAEDAYFSQYNSVQPAMDPHDPDEVVEPIPVAPPLGLARPIPISGTGPDTSPLLEGSAAGWSVARSSSQASARHTPEEAERLAKILHPRPASAMSSHSSGSSAAVARLEELADKKEQNEFGVKKHVSRTMKGLFLLCRSSGIDREEFERMVKTELDVLSIMEEEDDA